MSVMAIFCKQIAPIIGDVLPVGAAFRGEVPTEHPAESTVVNPYQAGEGFVHDISWVRGFEIAVEGFCTPVFPEETPEEFISFSVFHFVLNLFTAAKIWSKTDNFCQVWEITGKILSFV